MVPISRRSALQGLAALAGGSTIASWARASTPALSFLAVGDWGRDGAFHQREVAWRMGETAAALGARFVISVGDNFYEDGVLGLADPKWRTSFEEIYRAPSLQIPWHVVLGNHDYHGDAQAQVDYSATSSRWRMPARWFSRPEVGPDGATLELFFLDTSPFISGYRADGGAKVKVTGQDPAAQLAWFDGALGASRADWKVVVGHHPVWSGEESSAAPDMRAKVDPILQRHGAALYLNGHDHDLQHFERGGVHYVCTGAGSQMDERCDLAGGDFCSVRSGFTALNLTRSTLRVAFRDWTGAELRVVDIARPT